MPYPYNNDLGKNMPKDHLISPQGNPFVDFPIHKKKPAQLPAWASKPLTQAEMKDILFGSKPGTLKFPKVLPLATTKDYPGNHPANKWGKPDPTMIPDDKVDTPKGNWAELVEAELKAMEKKYPSHLYQDIPLVQGKGHIGIDFAKGPSFNNYQELPVPYSDSKPAPQFLGKVMDWYDPSTMSQKIGIELRVKGLGIGDLKLGVAHSIADHAAFNMNTDMLSHVLDETFAKMKKEIMKTVVKKASEK